jgi:hypothetical protein
MPRYYVQRTFPDGSQIPVKVGGADICGTVIRRNARGGGTGVNSFGSEDKTRTSCCYDAVAPLTQRNDAA